MLKASIDEIKKVQNDIVKAAVLIEKSRIESYLTLGITPNMARYLMTLLIMSKKGNHVRPSKLAKELGLGTSAVTLMTKRMEKQGLVKIDVYSAVLTEISLTQKGLDLIEKIQNNNDRSVYLIQDTLPKKSLKLMDEIIQEILEQIS